jgi:hypothetical protein
MAVQANIKVYNIVWRVSPADSRMNEKGDSPVHEAPALRGSREGSDTVGVYAVFPCKFARGCFHDTRDLLVTRRQLYHCAKAPLPRLNEKGID